MCEFCSFGPNSNKQDRDQSNPSFSGFFSTEAIEAAVRQAKEQTRRNRRARRLEVYIQQNNGVRPSSSDPELLPQGESGEDDDGDGNESDDDTT